MGHAPCEMYQRLYDDATNGQCWFYIRRVCGLGLEYEARVTINGKLREETMIMCIDCNIPEKDCECGNQDAESVRLNGCYVTEHDDTENFTFVNIATKGCDGWLNLFFGECPVALVDDVELADRIRLAIKEKKST